MMTIKVRIILTIIFVLALLWIIRQIKRRKLDLRYTLSWLALMVALIILVLFPNILIVLSDFFGIYSPVNMIFFCGFAFSLVIIYSLTAAVSKLTEEVKQLSQNQALIEYETKELPKDPALSEDTEGIKKEHPADEDSKDENSSAG